MSSADEPTYQQDASREAINFSRPRRETTLAPPIASHHSPNASLDKPHDGRVRESRLDSADMAEGKFDLYGSDRDSWQNTTHFGGKAARPELAIAH